MPDFRAAERSFQLLTQAAGRAGRGDLPGRVVIQTLNPDHYAIQLAAGHDYEGFYRKEIEFRKWLRYPPFRRLCKRHSAERESRKTPCGSVRNLAACSLPLPKAYAFWAQRKRLFLA